MPHSIHNLEQEPKNPIIFDKGEILPSHDDPLVITIQVMSYEIRRVIIDKLSSSNPMYIAMLRKMGVQPEQITRKALP